MCHLPRLCNTDKGYEDTNIEALKGISFEVQKGQTLAIIGNTGSGKSTILELIGRLYDVQKGQIEVDGETIKNLNLNSLRSSIGFVPQDPFLFSDSLRNNIKLGKNKASEATHKPMFDNEGKVYQSHNSHLCYLFHGQS